MIMTNEQWTGFRDRLLDAGFKTLWSVEGNRRTGLSFDLVCMNTEKGATIFQVWRDGGFAVYTDTSPNTIDGCFEFLAGAEVRK